MKFRRAFGVFRAGTTEVAAKAEEHGGGVFGGVRVVWKCVESIIKGFAV